jgi:hypothetical protein
MKINVRQPVLDYEGKPLMVNKTNPDGSMIRDKDNNVVQEQETLRSYMVLSLNNLARGETEEFTPEQKAKIYSLTTKIYKSKEVTFSSDDIVFIKERVGKVYGPLVFGRICDMLEQRKISLPDMSEGSEKKDDNATE